MIPQVGKQVGEVISRIVTDCISHEVSVHLTHSEKVKQGEESEELACSGYFDDDNKLLAVAVGNSLEHWFPVLLHEYNHFLQWQQEREWWNRICKGYEVMFSWLDKQTELSPGELSSAIEDVIELEADCERRTAEMILREKLPIDLTNYIKGANAYLYSYQMVKKYRQWYVTPPYRIPEIMERMPVNLQSDYSALPIAAQLERAGTTITYSEELEKLYVEKCMNRR